MATRAVFTGAFAQRRRPRDACSGDRGGRWAAGQREVGWWGGAGCGVARAMGRWGVGSSSKARPPSTSHPCPHPHFFIHPRFQTPRAVPDLQDHGRQEVDRDRGKGRDRCLPPRPPACTATPSEPSTPNPHSDPKHPNPHPQTRTLTLTSPAPAQPSPEPRHLCSPSL